jgi:putative tricarboxylic transport membrane protein
MRSRRVVIRNPRDFFGGLALIGLALFALWASRDLPGSHGFAFGPGTAPRMFAVLLGGFGVAVAIIGFFTEGPALERFAIRGPFFITAALCVFAATIRPLGLVISSFLTIMVCAAGTEEVRWIEAIICTVALTIFCTLLFPYALNLPFQIWPRF